MNVEQMDFSKQEEKVKPKLNIRMLFLQALIIAACLFAIYYIGLTISCMNSFSSIGGAIAWAGFMVMVQFPVWIPVIATISLFVSWVIEEYKVSNHTKKEVGTQPQLAKENNTDLYVGMMGIDIITGVVIMGIFEALRAFCPELFCGVIRNGCRGNIKSGFDSLGMIIATGLVIGLGYWLASLFCKKKAGEKKTIPLILKVSLVVSSILIVVVDLMIKNAITEYYYY